MKKVAILGSTGEIGKKTVECLKNLGADFKIYSLCAKSNFELLAAQSRAMNPAKVALLDGANLSKLRAAVPKSTKVLRGIDGVTECCDDADIVVFAMSGLAALRPCMDTLESGKTLAIANKEILVAAGEILVRKCESIGVKIIPVDSEHSGVFQILERFGKNDVARVTLTASGGPFLRTSKKDMQSVTVEQALNHPVWKMGKRITVDSATLMNKALEIVEAKHLFGLAPETIDVVVHPKSIIHCFVALRDGSIVANLSFPDMRIPIQLALTHPRRLEVPEAPKLDISKMCLQFESPDRARFPAIGLGVKAAKEGGTMPTVLQAADEVAVEHFIAGNIKFVEIASIVADVMDDHKTSRRPSLDSIFEADKWAREKAGSYIQKVARC